MIVVLGGSGYVGQAFVEELRRRDQPHLSLSRSVVDYTQYTILVRFLRESRPAFLINAAGFTGKPNVEVCEAHKSETLLGNVLLPQTILHACDAVGIPWGHVSSGCIYNGAKIIEGERFQIVNDLTREEVRSRAERSPESIVGFNELDEPNFSFRHPPCSFYSGTKALCEEVVSQGNNLFIWRMRIPFDEHDNPRNYLSKLQRYAKVYDNMNSLSHRGDFATACLNLWEKRAPFGTYNVTNPGFVYTRHVITMIREHLRPDRHFEFWADDAEFYRHAATTPRSNCVLDVSKLAGAGVAIRPVLAALDDSLRKWR